MRFGVYTLGVCVQETEKVPVFGKIVLERTKQMVIRTDSHACVDSNKKRRYNNWKMLNDGGKRKELKRESQ